MQDQLSKNLHRRKQIKRDTLVVGLDIGSRFNSAALMNKDGKVLRVYDRVYNSRRGFNFFEGLVKRACERYGFRHVIVGMEPTSHYWRKLGYFCRDQGYRVCLIRTTSVKHQRALDESSPSKSDPRDAVTLANLVREGKYLDTHLDDGVYRQLRVLAKSRERLSRYYNGTRHRLGALVDDYFPELKELYCSVTAKGLLAVLAVHPFPEDVLAVGVGTLERLIHEATGGRGRAKSKAAAIYRAAGESIGLKCAGDSDRLAVAVCVEELQRVGSRLSELEAEIERLVLKIPYSEYLLSIPRIGYLSVGIFFGELGDPARFDHYNRIVKFAGLDLVSRDSGLRIGGRRISKKGRHLLRKILYYMTMRLVGHSAYFSGHYVRLCQRGLCRKAALCAVSIKLIRVIFALIRDRRHFSAESVAQSRVA